jgi:hypothetical protein
VGQSVYPLAPVAYHHVSRGGDSARGQLLARRSGKSGLETNGAKIGWSRAKHALCHGLGRADIAENYVKDSQGRAFFLVSKAQAIHHVEVGESVLVEALGEKLEHCIIVTAISQ